MARRMKYMQKIRENPFLALEFTVLCLVLPTVIIAWRLAPFMFVFLWGAALYCLVVYRLRLFDGWSSLWGWGTVTRENMRGVLFRWALCSAGMFLFIWAYDPERMFMLVRERPQIISFLLVFYPLLSGLPQQFIFCAYFFRRYAPFFTSERSMIIASTIVFSYAHMLFINWVAPSLSLVAGAIFAATFARHRSLALSAIEHGLVGNMLFLLGLGWYFYGGAVHP